MKKTILSVLVALVLVASLVLAIAPNAMAADNLQLHYDDRKDLSQLIGKEAAQVEITDQTVISKAVGTASKDAAVLTYDAATDTLYAVGTGTATIVADGERYSVTVSPAPISMFLITGHSVGYGQYGNAAQSVAIEPGQAYSSWFRDSLSSGEGGLGYGAASRVGGTGNKSIDAFAQGNSGTLGVGSALAYNWNQLTGEKAWVINLAIPGSCINEWLPGVHGWHTREDYSYKYESVLKTFGYAQQIMKNEIAAGHYELNHMSMIYFSGANFGNAGYNDWTYESLKSDYETLWNGLKKDLALDMDGDGDQETLESLSFVPFWTPTNQTYIQDKAVNYYLAASEDYPDVFMASDLYRNWMVQSGLSTFPAINYTTQSQAVSVPTVVSYTEGQSSVFCQQDNSHLSQVAYNAVGMDIAKNLHNWYTQSTDATAVVLRNVNATAFPDALGLGVEETRYIVPVVTPSYASGITVEVTGGLEAVFPMGIKATSVDGGTVTIKAGEQVLKTISVTTVAAHDVHCACGGHAAGMQKHTCQDLTWIPWGNEESEKNCLPTATGNYYLADDITISTAQSLPSGTTINLCLNGYDINGSSRVISGRGNLSITDCGAKADWGTIRSTQKSNYGGILYLYEKSVTNLYAGNLDASGTKMLQGGVAVVGNSAAATLNIYGGTFTGGTLVANGSSETRGGVLYLIAKSTVNLYGGELIGGTSVNNGGSIYVSSGTTFNMMGGTVSGGTATGKGGNIYVAGTANLSGGTISGGTATGNGGNIAVSAATVNLTGTTVTGGVTNGHGGNIDLADTSTLNMSGGTVSNGSAKSTNQKQGGNINLNSGSVCNVSGGTVSGGAAGGYGGNICGTPGAKITVSGTALITGGKTGVNSDGTAGSGGNIFAGCNDSVAATITISGGTISDGKALVGGNVYADGKGTMTGGTVSGGTTPTTSKAMGGNFFVSGKAKGGSLTISGGTISGGLSYAGGAIYSKGNVSITGGTITGGRASNCGGNIYQFNDKDRTLSISGGTITLGATTATAAANKGGNIYLHGENNAEVANAVISGGTISKGNANCGGNIFCAGTLTISDGLITEGTVSGSSNCGGNLYINSVRNTSTKEVYTHVTMLGGTISNGTAGYGGNVQTHGNFTMLGGELVGGKATDGGNVRIFRPGRFVLDGGTVSGGEATSYGGTFQVVGHTYDASATQALDSKLTVKSGTITGGKAANGGAICINQFGILDMQGGTVTGGTATSNGGNIYANNTYADRQSALTVSGGTVTGGKATNGGNLYIGAGGGPLDATISGGTFTQGVATGNGGNLAVCGTAATVQQVTITGGEFVGGTAAKGGNAYIANAVSVEAGNCQFSGGAATEAGNCVYIGRTDDYAGTPTIELTEGVRMTLFVDNSNNTDSDHPVVDAEALTPGKELLLLDAANRTETILTSTKDCSSNFLSAADGYKTVWAEGNLTMTEDSAGKVIAMYNGTKRVAEFSSFAAAAQAVQYNGTYLKLLGDVDAQNYLLTETVWVDLAGHNLSNLQVAGTFYGMDSTTNSYKTDRIGTLTATVVQDGQIASNCKTDTQSYGSIKRYLAIEQDGSYTFHRFYIGITKLSIATDTIGVGYKAVFGGDDAVKSYLDPQSGYGYNLWLDENAVVTQSFGADNFVSLDEVALRLDHFIGEENTAEENRLRATAKVHATVFIKLATGEVIETDPVSYTFQQMLELANESYNKYSVQQKEGLDQLSAKCQQTVFDWAINEFHHPEGGVWQPWQSATSLPTSGVYYLTQDVKISKTVDIPFGSELTLCLNGHTVEGSVRLLRVYGKMDLCDCCHKLEEEQQGHMIGHSSGIGPVFYTYFGSVFNIYAGNLYATEQVSQGGVGIVGNDKDKTREYPEGTGDSVVNMYGGKIYGGNVTGSGGNITTFHGGTWNMYGGQIYGGQAVGNGGNINLSSNESDNNVMTLNVYGGQIYGGFAGGNGGNVQSNAYSAVHVYSGNITDGIANNRGGNIYSVTDVTVTGGQICDGRAANGGNISFAGTVNSSLTWTGGEIYGGSATYDGGNIHISNQGTYLMEGVTVRGGVAGNDGGNIYILRDMNEANTSLTFPTVTLDGVTVTGGQAGDKGSGVYVMEGDLILSGDVNITENEGSNLYLDAAQTVQLQDLAETAKVGISMNVPASFTADVDYADNLTSDDPELAISPVADMLKLTGGKSANVPVLSGFSVGWYRDKITPKVPVPLDGMGNNEGRMQNWAIKSDLYAGFTVIADQTGIENAIVLVSVDTLFIQKELSDNLRTCISEATGIAPNRIFFSASHTHCGVDHDAIYEDTREYLENFYSIMTEYAVLAVEDLAPATIETASIDVISEEGNSLNLSRRYIGDDGNAYSSVDSSNYPAPAGAERESLSDPELQLIRFVRDGKDDVILTNWQAHPSGHASGTNGYISAENWKVFRESVESQLDGTVCTFFLGAAGNLGWNTNNLSSFTAPDGVTYKATDMAGKGNAMAAFAVAALTDPDKVTQVTPGTLGVVNYTFETEHLYKSTTQQYKNIDLDLNAISIGNDIAFITAPYEMFHENGSQIKAFAESIGFETCFVLTNSGGENKYIGANNSFENDNTDGKLTSFGVRTCRYVQGTAELLIDQYADMLSQLQGVSARDTIYKTYTVQVVDTDGNAVQNVMLQLIGGNNARNCSDADGTITYYIYDGIEYAVQIVKLPEGYKLSGATDTFAFNSDRTVTVVVEKA